MDDLEIITLTSFVGQKEVVEMLKVSIEASQKRQAVLGHVLLVGERGSGKNTLSIAIANELEAPIKTISFNAIKKDSELAAALSTLSDGDILLVDHIDSLKPDLATLLCTAIDDFYLDIVVGKGPAARSIRLELPHFTLIAMTDNEKNIPSKIADCFPIVARLGKYSKDELARLAKIFCRKSNVNITDDAADQISLFAEGSYRKLMNVLKRARDFATVKNNDLIDGCIADTVIHLDYLE